MFIDSSRFQIPFHFFYLLRPNLKYLNFKKSLSCSFDQRKIIYAKRKTSRRPGLESDYPQIIPIHPIKTPLNLKI